MILLTAKYQFDICVTI